MQLSAEPSWSNIADKLSYGRLQAAVMPPPLAFAVALGRLAANPFPIVMGADSFCDGKIFAR